MRRRSARVLALAATAVALTGCGTSNAAVRAHTSPTPLPVVYSLTAAADAYRAHHGNPLASPPGSNAWSCKPSVAHPRPVVLVHAMFSDQLYNWTTMAPLLAGNGYCVFSLTYGTKPLHPRIGGMASIRDSARELSRFVDRVRTATHATRVDLVGHSEGTVVSAYYLKLLGGAAKVSRDVAFSPVYQGTTAEALQKIAALPAPIKAIVWANCTTCLQLRSGSSILKELNSGGTAAVPGVTYTNIQSTYDTVVVPLSNGTLHVPNATNITLQDGCAADHSDHRATIADRRAGQLLLNALDSAHPRPVPCGPVTTDGGW
jgi:triacylglycerol lipase